MPSLQYTNSLPDCLFMKLHCEPVQIAVQEPVLSVPLLKNIYKNESTLPKKYSLKLTLRFGEQTESFRAGSIAFGLKGGQLKLKLTNAKLLLETVKLTPKFSTDVLVETVEEKTKETNSGLDVKLIGGMTGSYKTTNKVATKYQNISSQVSLQGTEEEPIWNFQTRTNNFILRGLIQEELIGILELTGDVPRIEAFFEFQEKDIQLTTGTGLIAKNIGFLSQQQGFLDTALLERKSVLKRISSKIGFNSNIISKAEVTYD